MSKKNKSDEPVFGAQLLKHPVVQKALADVAVAAVLAIAAKFGDSEIVKRASAAAGEDLSKVAKKAGKAAKATKAVKAVKATKAVKAVKGDTKRKKGKAGSAA